MKRKSENTWETDDTAVPCDNSEIDFIDLDDEDEQWQEEGEDYDVEDAFETKEKGRTILRFINPHVILILTFLILIVSVVIKIRSSIRFIHQDDIAKIEGDESREKLDMYFPVMSEDGEVIDTSNADTILVFGNSPFSDDRGSEDNLANLIAQRTGADVYNCSISGSYMTAANGVYDSDTAPMDAYTFYWMAVYATLHVNGNYFADAAEALGDDIPPEAEEVLHILDTVDMNEVDAVAIMYDATDYLMGNWMYSDDNSTDIQYFTGNLEAGIELFQTHYPQIRIILLSPTYAFAVTEEGKYVSSDMYTYGQDVLSTYSLIELRSAADRGISFVDNIYGTITEENAQEYLIDNLHLNTAGRNLVADRFIEALNYYQD